MKNILITGANSYIGTCLEKHLSNSKEYNINVLDMKKATWNTANFSNYDCIIHVAGIAHIKETRKNAHLYYNINRDLTFKTAQKAKLEGVKQFIFLSSMSVFGMLTGKITPNTTPKPNTHYGKSKLQAEKMISALQNDHFKVSIIRPPMVYGKNCKGNFPAMVKLVNKLPIFPYVKNKRSMIYIDNLCEFIKLCIDKQAHGTFHPQDKEYINTTIMAQKIADMYSKRLWISRLAGFMIAIFRPIVPTFKKAFGTLIYENMERFNYSYCIEDNGISKSLSITN